MPTPSLLVLLVGSHVSSSVSLGFAPSPLSICAHTSLRPHSSAAASCHPVLCPRSAHAPLAVLSGIKHAPRFLLFPFGWILPTNEPLPTNLDLSAFSSPVDPYFPPSCSRWAHDYQDLKSLGHLAALRPGLAAEVTSLSLSPRCLLPSGCFNQLFRSAAQRESRGTAWDMASSKSSCPSVFNQNSLRPPSWRATHTRGACLCRTLTMDYRQEVTCLGVCLLHLIMSHVHTHA